MSSKAWRNSHQGDFFSFDGIEGGPAAIGGENVVAFLAQATGEDVAIDLVVIDNQYFGFRHVWTCSMVSLIHPLATLHQAYGHAYTLE